MAYDSARQVVVMFGGCGAAGGDTWEYDGVDWRGQKTAAAPSAPRRYTALAYDSNRKRSVLFGGRDLSGGSGVLIGDTWEYAGRPCGLTTNTHEISMLRGGTQQLTIDGGAGRLGHLYWIFGSATGTSPGLSLNGMDFPLNPDIYTQLAMDAVNTATFVNFRGVLLAGGRATASFVVPPSAVTVGLNLHHAGLILLGNWECTTNPVAVQIR